MILLPLADIFVPDGEDARRQAAEELSKQEYQAAKPTWFDEFVAGIVQWFVNLFTQNGAGGVAPFALTLIIGGTILATLFSSAGPILYDQVYGAVRYGDLADTLRRYPENGNVFRFSGYLLDAYAHGRPTLGGGISAMPSMHVAIATLNAFYLSRINRALGLFGWAFALTILFGSIYTGWHYAVDGYVSILLASAIWLRIGRQLNKAAASPIRQAWQAA